MFPADKSMKKQLFTASAGGSRKVTFLADNLELFFNINSFGNMYIHQCV